VVGFRQQSKQSQAFQTLFAMLAQYFANRDVSAHEIFKVEDFGA